ncbi:MAG: hypothetical protein M1817_004747 [Caeruleum heppii]|nr:MAG: hypothetical protein M1817_004747 [Caeruleum heppii]
MSDLDKPTSLMESLDPRGAGMSGHEKHSTDHPSAPASQQMERNDTKANGTVLATPASDQTNGATSSSPAMPHGDAATTSNPNEKGPSTASADGSTKPDGSPEHLSPAAMQVIPQIRRVDWDGFKNTITDSKPYAVDVLMSKPNFFWQRRQEEMVRKRQQGDNTPSKGAGEPSPTENPAKLRREMPERVRVNSRPVLAILANIAPTKSNISRNQVGVAPPKSPTNKDSPAKPVSPDQPESKMEPVVFLRPYPFFVHYEQHIRAEYEFLEQKWKALDMSTTPNVAETNGEGRSDSAGTNGTSTGPPMRIEHKPAAVDIAAPTQDGVEEAKTVPKDFLDTVEAYRDLKCLLEFLDAEVFSVARGYRSCSSETIYFRDLWLLFKPGEEVYVPANRKAAADRQTVFRVLQVSPGRPMLSAASGEDADRPPTKPVNQFALSTYYIDYDGDEFGPCWKIFEIQPYEGEKDITSLSIYPFRYFKDHDKLRSQLLEQGKKFMQFRKPTHQYYTGRTLTEHPGGKKCELVPRSETIEGAVIVDFKEACRSEAAWLLVMELPPLLEVDKSETKEDYPLSVWDDWRRKKLIGRKEEVICDEDFIDELRRNATIAKHQVLARFEHWMIDELDGSSFGDDELVLLPKRVCAFILTRRKFALLPLDGLRPVSPGSDGWKDLKLAKETKRMVQSQVQMHFEEKKARDANSEARKAKSDLVSGKGEGLIILLHGPPGVGKTSTAECVAEYLGQPLYPITCGDLGTTAKDVEVALNETFTMAEAWGCVLLLDEADVFLAERQKTDLKRNALVSVFLRILEYYTGILFLTTNRVGALDEAFNSRIHAKLYFPPFNLKQSRAVWMMNMQRMKARKGSSLIVNESEIMAYAEEHHNSNRNTNTQWNGRQIRSAFQTATALAEFEAFEASEARGKLPTKEGATSEGEAPRSTNLRVDHFKTVAKASSDFDDYFCDIYGYGKDDRARYLQHRADDFRPKRHQSLDEAHISSSPYRAAPMGGLDPHYGLRETMTPSYRSDQEHYYHMDAERNRSPSVTRTQSHMHAAQAGMMSSSATYQRPPRGAAPSISPRTMHESRAFSTSASSSNQPRLDAYDTDDDF